MNVELIEPHPRRVLDAFRQGEFDGLEILGQADEKNFFELCFRQKMLDALAAQMPTAREKEEVPRWFVLAANLSLKLHGENAFLAWERVVRCGGLLSALDPAVASKHLDPTQRQVLLQCVGFNQKNEYDRERLHEVLSASAEIISILEGRSQDDVISEYKNDMNHVSPLNRCGSSCVQR